MRAEGDAVRVRIDAGIRVPPGGIVLRPPLPDGTHSATIGGAPAEVSPDGEVTVRSLPTDVTITTRAALGGGSQGVGKEIR